MRKPARAANPVPHAHDAAGLHPQETSTVEGNGHFEHAEVARLAYSYWEARGYQGGSPEEDWFRALTELRHRRQHLKEGRPAARARKAHPLQTRTN